MTACDVPKVTSWCPECGATLTYHPGRTAYEAYAKYTNWKTFNGSDMPLWGALPSRIQEAWLSAALAAGHEAAVEDRKRWQGLTFGEAIRYLKCKERVAREGWNGKGMWLALIEPGNAMYRDNHQGRMYDMQVCIGMKTAQGNMQPGWLASQQDMLAEDWFVVNEKRS